MLFKLRGIYNTMMQYLPIIALIWAVVYSGAGVGWWIACVFMIFIMNVYGFGVGFHHTFSHRTFKFNRPIEIALMFLGTWATLVAPISWSSAHGSHHRYVDQEEDPHAPSVLGWRILFFYNHNAKTPSFMMCRHLFKDKLQVWIDGHIGYWVVVLSLPIISFLLFGVYGLVFLWAVPTFYTLLTGLIFCLAHYGETNEEGHKAQNNWVLNLFSFGDGDHRLHHTYWNHTGKFHEWCALLIGKKS